MTPDAFSSGDAAWMLVSASLVLLMTPGLALFYGGMAGNRHVLNMMMMSFGALALVPVLYVLWGWSMSYAGSSFAGIVGNPFEAWGLRGQITGPSNEYLLGSSGYPAVIDIGFQATFAIISTAIISGAIAGRVKFSAWLTFAAIWVTFAYFPLAHMVWGGGILSHAPRSLAAWLFGVSEGEALIAPIDFAGGTVVHISAGAAALVLAIVVGPRRGFAKPVDWAPNRPMVMVGAALRWLGWLGLNGGSAFAADGLAGVAWLNTTVAAAAAMLGWMLVERIRDHAATSLGAASGAIAGLVAITPAAGALSPLGSIALGFLGGIIACLCIGLKYRWGFDDSLDVVGVHLCAGLWGTIGLAFFATDNGILTGHFTEGLKLLVVQTLIAVVAMLVSGLVTLLAALLIRATMGWRIEDEAQGSDLGEHRETAYDFRESVASHRRHAHDARISPAPTVQPRVDTAGAKE